MKNNLKVCNTIENFTTHLDLKILRVEAFKAPEKHVPRSLNGLECKNKILRKLVLKSCVRFGT